MTPGFARSTLHVGEVGSTSDLARSLVEAGGVELPLLVRADRQTAGRGRGANRWWSDDGGLLFTLAVEPSSYGIVAERAPRVALAAAVAIVDAIGVAHVGIRWPNDVEVCGRKLAGILPEWVVGASGAVMLIGVGVNVSTRFEGSPAEVTRLGASVGEFRQVDAGALLDAILSRLGPNLEAVGQGDPGLAARWAALDTLRGTPIRVDLGGPVIEGVGDGIAADGGLWITSAAGRTCLYGGRVLR